MKIVVYREGANDIIQEDSSLTVDAAPTKLLMAATRSSMYVSIFPAVGSGSWLTIFRSCMIASYSLLLTVFLKAPSVVLNGINILKRHFRHLSR